jgi:predicted XRE-type DNA-binding protein
MKTHWTARSIKDYLFRIAADFIAQLQNKMEATNILQDDLAKRLGVTKGRVSQLINHPGNFSLRKMIEYAKALGMKVSVVAYDDNDTENKMGPIDSEIFKTCWEQLGRPRDFWTLQDIITSNTIKFGRRKEDFSILQAKKISAANIADYPTYFSIERVAGNETPINFKSDEQLSS